MKLFKRNQKNNPVITVGMAEATVRKLLGKPKSKREGATILNELAANSSQLNEQLGSIGSNEYAMYEHAAGVYQIVFNSGKVVEVHSQP